MMYRYLTIRKSIVDDVQVFDNKEKHMTQEIECTRKEGIKHNFDKCFIKTKWCSL